MVFPSRNWGTAHSSRAVGPRRGSKPEHHESEPYVLLLY